MKERIDILVPDQELRKNPEKVTRLEKTFRFEETDRVPVIMETQQTIKLSARGSDYNEYLKSPLDNMRGQILNFKWRVENIHDDEPIETEQLLVWPDFGALRAVEFPVEIEWSQDGPPRVKHLLHSSEEIDNLAFPEPNNGFNAVRIQWYQEMCARVDDFDVRLNGGPLRIKPTIEQHGGPVPTAFALCGSNLFLWMLTDPDRVHKLMEIVTNSQLNCIAFFDQMTGIRERTKLEQIGADIAEMAGPNQFREFFLPYYQKLWQNYQPPRIYHMCGKIDHLLELLITDLHIDYLNGFGFSTSPQKIAKILSGKILLRGGPHPGLFETGTKEEIIAECTRYMKLLGAHGGYIFCDGFGLPPATPVENINAALEASIQLGSLMKA
jgi:uroporphyrinogen-III decarboxylase